MSSIILIVFVISGLIALKKPIIGAICGSILTVVLFFILNNFEIGRFLITLILGIGASFSGAYMIGWLFSGFRGGKHNTGPSYWGGGDRRGHTGGIILSDEERKNMLRRK